MPRTEVTLDLLGLAWKLRGAASVVEVAGLAGQLAGRDVRVAGPVVTP